MKVCDSDEEEKPRPELARRSLIVKVLLRGTLAVLAFSLAPCSCCGRKWAWRRSRGPYTTPRGEGKYTYIDISHFWNDVGIAASTRKSLSNCDQEGRAFAQEACPSSFGPNLPVISCPNDGAPFVFPDQTDKVMNVLKCQSDRVDVVPGGYSSIHILGA
jgi:hypothetical protein